MTRAIWLASYPKSGNTWVRMLLGVLALPADSSLDINSLPGASRIASAREPFDDCSLLDSSLLTHDEIECLRPRIHEGLARGLWDEAEDHEQERSKVRFTKVHDAYTLTPSGEPLLAGARGADGAIVIVRDPRDVASSLANHNGSSIDAAIALMGDPDGSLSGGTTKQYLQLRQRLLSWSAHVASWLDQQDIPVHLVKYEDLHSDAVDVFGLALDFVGLSVNPALLERAIAMTGFGEMQRQEQDRGFREASGAYRRRVFFRRGQVGSWRHELTPGQIAAIEAAHAPMMRRLGYELVAGQDVPALEEVREYVGSSGS